MADFQVEIVGDSPEDMQKRLGAINQAARQRTNDALMETARDIKDDLEKTSPVDTGEYQKSWYIFPVDYNEVWILNEADHAKYVILPNSKMVNSSSADLPSQGILHNIKGVAKGHQSSLQMNMADEFKDLINAFKVKR